ncbi:hypothetical protein AYI70_g933 [Smittium culicis]|uniref:Uncharacterized protein n=1 Tax=Smittium culicis TaxID=133412 RepID=A0A1R1YFB7_9FUNG|nr:hypothetical protein AYI70_g933 [Smittium culicis]
MPINSQPLNKNKSSSYDKTPEYFEYTNPKPAYKSSLNQGSRIDWDSRKGIYESEASPFRFATPEYIKNIRLSPEKYKEFNSALDESGSNLYELLFDKNCDSSDKNSFKEKKFTTTRNSSNNTKTNNFIKTRCSDNSKTSHKILPSETYSSTSSGRIFAEDSTFIDDTDLV